jgi:hypothetical protein
MEKNTTARELHTTQFHLNMYTDLDTLYDTRLSFLERLSSKDWEFMLDNDRWITRLKDNMGNISDKIFNALFNNYREKSVLINAIPTLVIRMIIISAQKKHDDFLVISGDTPSLFLNIYPYDLDSREISLLKETLTKILYPYLKIKIISRRISEISPVWIKNKDIDLMFCYNGLEWLEYQMASMSIIENHLREVKLCIPKIVNGIIDSKDVTPELFIKHMGQQAGCIQLEYLDTAVFSADLLTYKRYNKLTEKKEDL